MRKDGHAKQEGVPAICDTGHLARAVAVFRDIGWYSSRKERAERHFFLAEDRFAHAYIAFGDVREYTRARARRAVPQNMGTPKRDGSEFRPVSVSHFPSSPFLHHFRMHFRSEKLDPLRQRLDDLRKLRVLLHQLQQCFGLFAGEYLPFLAGTGDILAVLRIGHGVRLVTIRLTGLRQQDQRRGIGGLKAECEVQQDKGIDIKLGEAKHIQTNPDRDDPRLRDQKDRRAKEASKRLRLEREPVPPKHRREMNMWQMKTEVMRMGRTSLFFHGIGCCGLYWHERIMNRVNSRRKRAGILGRQGC
jgi:hypothetical protein